MWIFMLVMMVIFGTRKRSQQQESDEQEGSASTKKSKQPTRKSRRRSSNIEANEQVIPRVDEHAEEQDKEETTDQPVGQFTEHVEQSPKPVAPPKRRGPSLNLKATRALQNLAEGSKISLRMDNNTKAFVGPSATPFATECGIVVRNVCPMKFHKWDAVPEDVKSLMYEKLEGKFELLRTNPLFMASVEARLHAQWKRTRGVLSQHWKDNGGKTNPQSARSTMHCSCRSQEDWNHLCDYWELEKTQNYSNQMSVNRGKQVNLSRGGSRSIANHVFTMTNPDTQLPPSPLEVYYKMHYNANKKGWLNDHSRKEYENIIRHKEAAVEKLNSEGTVISTTIEHKLEKEAIRSVCGKTKTLQSHWEIGVGPVLSKKDKWMNLVGQPSQQDSEETNEELRDKITELDGKLQQTEDELREAKDELQKSNKKFDRLSMFMSKKFPDFDIEEDDAL